MKAFIGKMVLTESRNTKFSLWDSPRVDNITRTTTGEWFNSFGSGQCVGMAYAKSLSTDYEAGQEVEVEEIGEFKTNAGTIVPLFEIK